MSTVERRVAVRAGETVSVTLMVEEKDARIVGGLWDPRAQDVVAGVDASVVAWAGDNWARTTVDPGNGTYTMTVAAGLWHLGYRVDPRSDYVGLMHHKNVPIASGQTVPAPLSRSTPPSPSASGWPMAHTSTSRPARCPSRGR
jgi:hypothetical protein